MEEKLPTLPAKQHRAGFYRGLRVGSDTAMPGSPGSLHLNTTHNEVFTDSTDCHADQCPVHQHYDSSHHQMRFLSNDKPPPIPKKAFVRTLSHPGFNMCHDSPSSPLQNHSQNFDNPLYMLARESRNNLQGIEESQRVAGSDPPQLSFIQLPFHTPNEDISLLLGSFDDQSVVALGIQHRQLLFLKSMVQRMEARVLLQGNVGTYQLQDFLLFEGSEPKKIGGCVYHKIRSAKFPGRVFALRVHKESPTVHVRKQLSHVNVQEVLICFEDPVCPSQPDCTAAKQSGGGSSECHIGPGKFQLPSFNSLLLEGVCMVIERDLPHITLEDFVQDGSLLGSTGSAVYDRQVCFLLLQVLTGIQHLHLRASAANLTPREIFLVWPNRNTDETEKSHNLKQDTSKIQTLWATQGSPRVVLTPLSSATSAPQSLFLIKSQITRLIQYCFLPEESSISPSSAANLFKSPHKKGLLYLASLFQSENSCLQMSSMAVMLQVLLWGPHVSLFNHRSFTTTAVHNWLTFKRALMVIKIAEKGLTQDQSALDWEDFVCLQYLSFTDPETIMRGSHQLCLILGGD